MHGTCAILLAFVTQADATYPNRIVNIQEPTEKLVDKMFKRTHGAESFHLEDLEASTLAKASARAPFQQALPAGLRPQIISGFKGAVLSTRSNILSSKQMLSICQRARSSRFLTSKWDILQEHCKSVRHAPGLQAPMLMSRNNTSGDIMSRRIALLAGGTSLALQDRMAGVAHAELKDYVLDGLGEEGIVDIPLKLGNAQNANVFEPDHLELTQGILYRLRLKNLGAVSHNFAAPEFIDRSFSILVRTGGGEGEDPLVEVKGPGIRVVGMKAGGRADWYLMPVRTGQYDFQCTVPGHEAMKGVITVKSSSSPKRAANRVPR